MATKRNRPGTQSRESIIKKTLPISTNGYIDCPYCETPFYLDAGHVDHIHPFSRGGSNRYSNLVLACQDCNKIKYDLPLTVFLYSQYITPEGVYYRLKKLNKTIPDDLLELLRMDD